MKEKSFCRAWLQIVTILPEYVNQCAQQIEQAYVWLHKTDVIFVKFWVDRLKEKNVLVFLKDKITSPPSALDLNLETYVLCIQTPFQLDVFQCLGTGFIGINVTHNVTYYMGFLLFMIVVRDQ